MRILHTALSLFRDYKPLTFFGALGLLLIGVSLVPGLVVVFEFIETGLVPPCRRRCSRSGWRWPGCSRSRSGLSCQLAAAPPGAGNTAGDATGGVGETAESGAPPLPGHSSGDVAAMRLFNRAVRRRIFRSRVPTSPGRAGGEPALSARDSPGGRARRAPGSPGRRPAPSIRHLRTR